MNRRDAIATLVAAAASLGAGLWWWRRGSTQGAIAGALHGDDGCVTGSTVKGRPVFPQRYARTLQALLECLVPEENDAPSLRVGAASLGVFAYIAREVTHESMQSSHRLLMRGAAVTERVAVIGQGVPFLEQSAEQRQVTVEALVDGAGDSASFEGATFIRRLVGFALEGMFADPRHGGNRDGRGWQALAYTMPQPFAPACHGGSSG